MTPEEIEAYVAKMKADKKARKRVTRDKWIAANPGYHNDWYLSNKERHNKRSKAYHLRVKYDITEERKLDMLSAQGGRCLICPRTEPGGIGVWHTDHRHGSKFVRGILCNYCNLGLGAFFDSPERMRAAAEYIENARIRETRSEQPQDTCADNENGPGLQCDSPAHQAA